MASGDLNLASQQRAQRKLLITAAMWGDPVGTSDDPDERENKQILGVRTEDSSIEFNADIATSTDIRGVTYTDVNKTEPQQTFDPMYILGGTELHSYLTQAALKNDIDKFNGVFDIVIITMFIDGSSSNKYYAVKHKGCSIIPTSIGGDSYVNMPVEIHLSNAIVEGNATVTGVGAEAEFTFTATT